MSCGDVSDKPVLTEEAGYEALHGHLVERALVARARYGPVIDEAAIRAILADRDVVRFPTELRFDAEPLKAGEFGWAQSLGERATEGFALTLHPRFEAQTEAIPLLAAYHIVTINYLDVATNEEAELFGATLLGMKVDEYYERICALADSI